MTTRRTVPQPGSGSRHTRFVRAAFGAARPLLDVGLALTLGACGASVGTDASLADATRPDVASARPDAATGDDVPRPDAAVADGPDLDGAVDASMAVRDAGPGPMADARARDVVVADARDAGPVPTDARVLDPGCVPDPAIRAGFPNNCTTGVPAGVRLVVVDHAHPTPAGLPADNRGWHYDTGSDRVIFDTAGAVMDGVDLETGTRTYGDLPANITIRNSRIRCQSVGGFCVAVADGGAVIDSDLGGGDSGTQFQGASTLYASGSAGAPASVVRTQLHSAPQNLKSDGYVTVTDSYLYGSPGWNDVWVDPSTGRTSVNTHSDQIFIDSALAVVLVHDTLRTGDNSTIDFTGAHSATSASVVRDSLFIPDLGRGTNPSHYGIGGGGTSGGLTLTHNVFGRGYANDAWQHGFGPAPSASGNVWSDGASAD